jgi:hypothetical protein
VVEEADDERDLFVVDPDDYQKTKQLEAIHKAKEEVREKRSKRNDIIADRGQHFVKEGAVVYKSELGESVAKYGSELLPLIEEANKKGVLVDEDLVVESVVDDLEVRILEYIRYEGRSPEAADHDDIDGNSYPEIDSMEVYRQLSRVQRKIGLGLEMDIEKGAAEI